MTHSIAFRSSLILALSLSPLAALAQQPAAEPTKEESENDRIFSSIEWVKGPKKVMVGEQGELQLPEGHVFTAGDGTRKMMQLMQNPTGTNELGLVSSAKLDWWVLFEFDEIGYVKDADKEKLDADDILDSIREGNEAGNEARKERGWAPIRIVGWHTKPFYNKETNNLEWCIEGESEGRKIINYNTRILGRGGVMSANLLVNPDELATTLPVVRKLLAGYSFTQGKRYGEWKAGDKVAKYGLSALVVGGAVGVAAKMGLLAKFMGLLAKGGKAIILLLAAVGAGLFSLVKKLLGRKQTEPTAPPPDQQAGGQV